MRHHLARNASLIALLIGLPHAGSAQTAPPGPNVPHASRDRGNGEAESVVVTAERRAVNVQKTPISIVALTGAMLTERGITDVNALQTQVPSLSYVDNGNTKYINIRGVGLDESSPNQTNGVAMNIDGAYVAREFNFNDPFFDLADIEVLRGPQGTYQGQNAEGGAIYINSAPPVLGQTSGFADAQYGNYDHYIIDGGVNVPLASYAALRVSVYDESRNSFYYNYGAYGKGSGVTTGNQPGNLNRILARIQLLLKPVDGLTVRLIEQHSTNLSDGTTFKSNAGPSGYGPYQLAYDTPEMLNITYNRVTGILDWDGSQYFRIHSVVAYQATNQQYVQDTDLTSPFVQPNVAQGTNNININDHYTTGELDILSKNSGRLDWTLGATFLDYGQKALVQSTSYNTPADPQTYSNPASAFVISVDAPRQNQAAFAEVGYKILPTLQLKIGGRFNHDRLGFNPDSYLGPAGPGSPIRIPLQPPFVEENSFTGRALLNWTPDPRDLFYFTVSRGYKPGGTTPFADVYSPEFVLNYEAGWKGSLLDGRLKPAISLFDMQYKNYQATIATNPFNPTLDITKNVQGSSVRGVEAQMNGFFGPFAFDLSGSYLDATYGNLTIFEPAGALGGGYPLVPSPINLGGRQLDYAPKFSLNAGASYTVPLPHGDLIAAIRYTYQSSQWTYFYDLSYDRIPSHGVLDMSLAYQSDARWRAELFGTNILNSLYIANTLQSTDGIGEYTWGAPAEFGARISYKF